MKTKQEVADLFRVSLMTIDRWIKSGKLNAIKIGGTVRITDEEIDRLMHQYKED